MSKCRYVVRSPHGSPYMSTLMLWGFLILLSKANPLTLTEASITGRLTEYEVIVKNVDCQELEKKMNDTYNEVFENLQDMINKEEGQAYRAWLGAYGGPAKNFLRGQLAKTIDVSTYRDEHRCSRDPKRPHITISGSVGKWFWSTGKLTDSVDSIVACNTCRSLAIIGLEYNSLVLHIPREYAFITTIGFEGVLEAEDIYTLTALLNSSTPWIKQLKNDLKPAIVLNLPERLLALYIATFLPTDIPLQVNWFILYNKVGSGRTLAHGMAPLNELVDALNSLRAWMPTLNSLIKQLFNMIQHEELRSDSLEALNLLYQFTRIRSKQSIYYLLRIINKLLLKENAKRMLKTITTFEGLAKAV